jgi:hypothetical protein
VNACDVQSKPDDEPARLHIKSRESGRDDCQCLTVTSGATAVIGLKRDDDGYSDSAWTDFRFKGTLERKV